MLSQISGTEANNSNNEEIFKERLLTFHNFISKIRERTLKG